MHLESKEESQWKVNNQEVFISANLLRNVQDQAKEMLRLSDYIIL